MKALASYWELTEQLLGQKLPQSIAESLIVRYTEQHRAYHTVHHLQDCFHQFERIKDQCDHADEVALALWFHDAIYDTRKHDNEEKSADLAVETLIKQKILPAKIERIRKMIVATKHQSPAADKDTGALLDIDIHVLGAEPARYAHYETQIREEYCWVPDALYKQGRKKILRHFLDQPRIYHTPLFFQERETQARQNLKNAISVLN
ncbi:MAG TPA: N-methyl-D-aspartate receptor NMDAR2C subunit [Pseudomonadales bacterium]|nr:N-methyl-D-aspartate receptor NMDAR2C subunit [Pseudomonadales bacterium]